ncbi:MltA domain-containing protein [Thalassotalea fonticola]|uniref:MltA domain-containing protein n=1 Tax=Thalassotalea fonticola TaxID=3065649 RepID=A0ABZ0GMQ2_9GAMM|nr:MltA domain-containing protein [Colwelliaceae bacterium S1-1]
MKLITTLFLASISFNAFTDNARFVLEPNPNIGNMQLFKTSDLCAVANNTNTYINNHKTGSNTDPLAVHAGKLITADISLDRVQSTLNFICTTYLSDVRTKQQSRLQNAEFLTQHFDFYRWYPDITTAVNISKKSTNAAKNRLLTSIPDDQLFITKYYTKLLKASPVKTTEFDQALYQLPFDEQGLTAAQAELKKDSLTRFKYTRQDIIQGKIAEFNLAKPLVWISEAGLHDVLLQGTGVLEVEGKTRYFNVHRNNGISYDYSIGKSEQARYWYFAEVPSVMGYGQTLESKIAVKPQVTFAGNMADLGLGKLIMVNYPLNGRSVSQMGILADTGGAFDNNRFQLDFLVDSYYGWADYHQANKHLPDYANTWIMLLKK